MTEVIMGQIEVLFKLKILWFLASVFIQLQYSAALGSMPLSALPLADAPLHHSFA